jgi:sarcosine oxidase, subunit beta
VERFDCVIVGGGIMGASTAWALAERGQKRVAIVERATVSAGASGRTGALLRRHYSNEPEARLAQLGYRIYRDWETTIGGSQVHTAHGLVVTVECRPPFEPNIEKLRANVAMQQRLGVDTEVISGDDLRKMQPFMHVEDLPYVALESTSGYVDAIKATREMALRASQLGATIYEACSIERIETSNGQVSGLRTSRGPIAADSVVVAAGPWSKRIVAPLGIDLPLTALRVQIAVVQRPLALQDPHFVLLDTVAGFFSRPWGTGTSLVGLGGGDQHDEVDPESWDVRNDVDYGRVAIKGMQHRIPAMAGASYLHGHAGLYDMTPDAHPIIGSTEIDGLFIAAGFSGAGFKKGPAVGLCLADLIKGDLPRIDLSPFELSRFQSDAWNRPWSETEYSLSSDFGHSL